MEFETQKYSKRKHLLIMRCVYQTWKGKLLSFTIMTETSTKHTTLQTEANLTQSCPSVRSRSFSFRRITALKVPHFMRIIWNWPIVAEVHGSTLSFTDISYNSKTWLKLVFICWSYTYIHTTIFIERQCRKERIGDAGAGWLGSESWLEKVWFKMVLKCRDIINRTDVCR